MEHLRAYLVDEVRLWGVTIVKNNAPVCEHSLCSYLTDWLLYFTRFRANESNPQNSNPNLASLPFLLFTFLPLSFIFFEHRNTKNIFTAFHLNFNKTLSQFLLFQVRERPTIQISNQRKIYVPINIMTQLRARSYLRVPIKFVRNFIPLPSKGASKGRYTHTHTRAHTLFFPSLPGRVTIPFKTRSTREERNRS